jgi:hypothetical protein
MFPMKLCRKHFFVEKSLTTPPYIYIIRFLESINPTTYCYTTTTTYSTILTQKSVNSQVLKLLWMLEKPWKLSSICNFLSTILCILERNLRGPKTLSKYCRKTVKLKRGKYHKYRNLVQKYLTFILFFAFPKGKRIRRVHYHILFITIWGTFNTSAIITLNWICRFMHLSVFLFISTYFFRKKATEIMFREFVITSSFFQSNVLCP